MSINIFPYIILLISLFGYKDNESKIDRKSLVNRNNPSVVNVDTLSSFTIGNGGFAFTVDATGLQTFPDLYKNGIPLGTQSDWGWHSKPNLKEFTFQDILKPFDFGRGKVEYYAIQKDESADSKEAANWFRANPHRIHLGNIGLALDEGVKASELKNISQQLDMWDGIIKSSFTIRDQQFDVRTVCHPQKDAIGVSIHSNAKPSVKFCFAYPSDKNISDGCEWDKNDLHQTSIIHSDKHQVILKRQIDETIYYVTIKWDYEADFSEKEKNYFTLSSKSNDLHLVCTFSQKRDAGDSLSSDDILQLSARYWNSFWNKSAVVDFSLCKDPRAKELERRVVLSQYLLATQCAGGSPPQETGLTYNSWYGKFHLEMVWWHQSHFALWQHPEWLSNTLNWYINVLPIAREIAVRQGFGGVRWMKMTDPSGMDTPSYIGPFLIWQQPHPIYLSELLYRAEPSQKIVDKYKDMIQQTAEFMYSFASYDIENDCYILKGYIPAQERFDPRNTVNSPFEMCYWAVGLEIAQKWRERSGLDRCMEWDDLIKKLSPLYSEDGIYPAAESVGKDYANERYTTDHMSVLGSLGIIPQCHLVDRKIMSNTLDWVLKNWNWDQTWGWDYPMTAMTAVRLGEAQKAIDILLMDKQTNTYLNNGHNFQNKDLRVYLPGNGGLLTTIALMCAGWDGNDIPNPGFPKDGNWDVRWEGLLPLP